MYKIITNSRVSTNLGYAEQERNKIMKKILTITLCTLFIVGSQQFIQAMEPAPKVMEPASRAEAPKVVDHQANIDLIKKTQTQISNTSWNNNPEKIVSTYDPKTYTSTQGTVNKNGSFDMSITKPKQIIDVTGKKSTIYEPTSKITQDKNGIIITK